MSAPPPRPLGDAMRDALPTFEAPQSLRAWAQTQAAAGTAASPHVYAIRSRGLRRFAYAAGIVIAAAAGWTGQKLAGGARGNVEHGSELVSALVDTHVRSLLADHLTDVQSSDHHTVKPWFSGKVNFAPRVPELTAQGFPLVGGRVEYVAGHTAAALVYGRRLHTINLFIWLASPSDDPVAIAAFNGYSLAHWTERGLTYWAVSDAAPAELQMFERAYTSSP